MEIRRRKIFKILTERDEEYEINAICFYQNYPWRYEARVLSEAEAHKNGYTVENVVMQYKRRLYLDLWLFTFYFEWFTAPSVGE